MFEVELQQRGVFFEKCMNSINGVVEISNGFQNYSFKKNSCLFFKFNKEKNHPYWLQKSTSTKNEIFKHKKDFSETILVF